MNKIKRDANAFKKMVDCEAGQRREIWGGTVVRTFRNRIAQLERENLKLRKHSYGAESLNKVQNPTNKGQ